MTNQRRITVAEVLEAYRVTGLKPERSCYLLVTIRRRFATVSGACALGACAVAAGVNKLRSDVSDWATRLLGIQYHTGFMSGFDGVQAKDLRREDPQLQLGYADGQACAAAVFGEGAKA